MRVVGHEFYLYNPKAHIVPVKAQFVFSLTKKKALQHVNIKQSTIT